MLKLLCFILYSFFSHPTHTSLSLSPLSLSLSLSPSALVCIKYYNIFPTCNDIPLYLSLLEFDMLHADQRQDISKRLTLTDNYLYIHIS